MTLLPLEVAHLSSDSSGMPKIVISVVLILAMIGVVGYLAWKSRKDQK